MVSDWPLIAKFTQWGIYAHMGNLFGLANQILLAALALGLICVIIWATGCGGSLGPREPAARHPSAPRSANAEPGNNSRPPPEAEQPGDNLPWTGRVSGSRSRGSGWGPRTGR
jgi:hypothetical protein